MTAVTSHEELRELLGEVGRRAAEKDRKELHQLDRDWLAASPFCLVSTSGAGGTCDVSPKGDPAGFTVVVDDTTIAIPERPGNKRADGFHNVIDNPHVGLIYLIPGRTDSLRINGRATIMRDAPYFDQMAVKGRRPEFALQVEIEQIFYHCAKAFLRSHLWQPDTWQPDALPRRAVLIKEVERPADTLADLDRHYGPGYADNLY
ncbi:pyridoxamine 5'-phosphate oxidase family protein [Asanoa sp. NPDC050611]|uniref:pyridoxamine 5'-phosphate oxidase family protein n=1 Tax=Asanoa sp. NPDC050611 TaxID=3157098 RepID=UPI0033F2AB08